MPSGEALYTVRHDSEGGNTQLGKMGVDGVVSPIGEASADIFSVRDANYDWESGTAYLLAHGDAGGGSCEIWEVDLSTGVFTHLWDARQDGDVGDMYCDAMTVVDSQIAITEDFNGTLSVAYFDKVTGVRESVQSIDISYKAAAYSSSTGDTVTYHGNYPTDGTFYDGFGGSALGSLDLDNIHSLAYTHDESSLWFIDWDDTVLVGTVDPETGNYDLYTNDLRLESGDGWGTDAILIGPADPSASDESLAGTGVNTLPIALTGMCLAALGAITGIFRLRRR
jgi:hypothetical protein